MAKPIQVTEATFESEVLQSKLPVLVDFYADWCGPCRAVAPVLEEIANELEGKLKIVKLDVDANDVFSFKFGVQSIPSLLIFQNGKEVGRLVGFMPKAQLLAKIMPHLTTAAATA